MSWLPNENIHGTDEAIDPVWARNLSQLRGS
jgi:hypothetical protein